MGIDGQVVRSSVEVSELHNHLESTQFRIKMNEVVDLRLKDEFNPSVVHAILQNKIVTVLLTLRIFHIVVITLCVELMTSTIIQYINGYVHDFRHGG